MNGIDGIVLPLPTPFTQDGEVDEAVLRRLVEFEIRGGVHALFLLGSFGQGPAMSVEERMRAAEFLMTEIGGRVPVIIHAGTADTPSTIKLARHAEKLSPAAIAVVPPYYYTHPEHEITAHMMEVASAVSCPVWLYDNPEFTRITVTPEWAARLAQEIPTLSGIKVAFADLDTLMSYVYTLPPRVRVYAGGITSLLPCAPLGVKGAIHPPTSAFPEVCVAYWDAIQRRDWPRAFALHEALSEASVTMRKAGRLFGRSAQAEMFRLRGLTIHRYPRWAARPVSPEMREELRKTADSLLAELGND